MFKSFAFRLVFIFTLIFILVIGTFVSLQNYFFTERYVQNVLNSVEAEAKKVSVNAGEYFEKQNNSSRMEFEKNMEFLSKRFNALTWVIDTEGNIISGYGGEDSFVGRQIPNNALVDDIRPVFEGKTVRTTGFFGSDEKDPIATICVPVFSGDAVIGAVVVNTKVANFSSLTKTVIDSMWFIPLVAVLIAALFVAVAADFISRPLKELNKLALEAGKGNFNYRYDINSRTEIAHIGENFNKMMGKLSQMDKFRYDFVQNASHELKAPITVISGYSQALMDDGLDEAKRKEYLGIILSETDRMKDLIEDMMSLSKIESGNEVLNKEHFNINDMLSRNLLAFEFEIEKKELEINVNYAEDVLEVCADKAMIEQVIINILQNAIKYTRQKDKIIVTTKQVKAKAYIEIMDTGIGIDKKDLESIFDRFYTVDKAKTPGKIGNGIGLSLVKRILEIHDSQIFVESEKDKFTKFYFYLDM